MDRFGREMIRFFAAAATEEQLHGVVLSFPLQQLLRYIVRVAISQNKNNFFSATVLSILLNTCR